jgi:uncharacterized membrane protein
LQRLKSILLNVTIALACLLAFIAVFESRIVIPVYLQLLGRMHPLMLHFPIVLFLLFIAYKLIFERSIKDVASALLISEWLLLLTAFTTVLTSLMGLFLSREPGYDADALLWHKWSGIAVTAIVLAWYILNEKISGRYGFTLLFSAAGMLAVLITGHLGAGITHGDDFLLAPIENQQSAPTVLLEDAVVFNDMVQPILQAKCMSCHNSKKAKGQLIMETEEMLLKGGRSGLLWDSSEADLGLLLRRIHLPIEQKKHMPPAGKPQLTDNEIAILTEWIKKGHNFKLKVIDVPVKDSLYLAASKMFSPQNETYDFPPADEKKVASLNTQNRIVRPLALESPAISVSFFNASLFKPEQLKDLLQVKQQVVSLNLNKIPVKDDDLTVIAQFSNLRTLNLSFTAVTGAALRHLLSLRNLRQLSLSGIPLKEADVKALAKLPELTHIYLWNSGIDPAAIAGLRQSMKQVVFETGFRGDTVVMQLIPPVLENEEQIITTPVPLKLKHYIAGTAIRYTLDETEPDSLSSPLYNDKIILDKNVTVKAKAFKTGWLGSDVLEAVFFKNTYRPDSAFALTPPDKSHKGKGANTLIDGKKGEVNFNTDKWLGYHDNRMEMLFSYNGPVTASSVTLSSIVDIGGYVMPAASIEVLGGNEKNSLKLLGKLSPVQPDSIKPVYLKGYEIKFAPVSIQYIKLIVIPVNKLPKWHSGKGEKGWVFADEVFIN